MELVRGKGGRGEIAIEGLHLDLIDVDRAVYVKGNPALYRRLAGPAWRRLQGRWLKASPGGGAFSALSSLTDPDELVGAAVANHGALASAPGKTIGGQPTVAVSDPSVGGTMYVAATGIPYPLEIVPGGGEGGRVLFDRWNMPVTLTPPGDVTNIKALQRVP